jgi:hypothetical protein
VIITAAPTISWLDATSTRAKPPGTTAAAGSQTPRRNHLFLLNRPAVRSVASSVIRSALVSMASIAKPFSNRKPCKRSDPGPCAFFVFFSCRSSAYAATPLNNTFFHDGETPALSPRRNDVGKRRDPQSTDAPIG